MHDDIQELSRRSVLNKYHVLRIFRAILGNFRSYAHKRLPKDLHSMQATALLFC